MRKTRTRARGVPTVLVAISMIGAAAGCGRDGSVGEPPPEVAVDTVGDTITVRNGLTGEWSGRYSLVPSTSIGSVDGAPEYVLGRVGSIAVDGDENVYVLDAQAALIRMYDGSGSHVRSFGRRGEGPGELASPSAIGVLSDGRVLARDPGNGRVQVFDAAGQGVAEWPVVHPGYATFEPLWVDERDRSFVVTVDQSSDFVSDDRIVIVLDPDGTALDTITPPTAVFDPPTLEAEFQSESVHRRASALLPFGPRAAWAVHPDGSIVGGFSDRYRIDVVMADGRVRRIERDYDPVPVTPEERDFWETRVSTALRRTDPEWQWNGPSIPTEKPPFKEVFVGLDGRIWVSVSTPGIQVENPYDERDENPSIDVVTPPDEQVGASSSDTVWSESVAFDVFSRDGRYLGRAEAPENFLLNPAPLFDADGAWSVTWDELGVQRVVRFSLRPGDA